MTKMNYNFNQSPVLKAGNGLQKYMTSVFNRMFMALCATGLVSFICVQNPSLMQVMTGGFSILLMIATLGIVLYLSTQIAKIPAERANILFWIYSALIGLSISPIFAVYTGESLANTFFTTAIFFGGMSLYGYVTKKDLTGMGSFMIVGLFSIIIASVINLFLKSSALQLGLSAISVVVFCGLTAYDIQKIRSFYHPAMSEEDIKKRSIIGALALYLDFINLFLALLRLMGNRK
ncbi:MAG: Bax inhibitor-1/YccA family protein [Alphaproteobacteria bacterium]|nr:Bax inhibitor-1/YccA family protein [Alphaproteobacteria bacterium]MBQ3945261.1 Bax inhibitor-1/YccA family protein [Alphaproteobacteria bacterium]